MSLMTINDTQGSSYFMVIRDVLNCTVSNVEKDLNVTCSSNSLKTVASVYSPLLQGSIKMKHNPAECNLEPVNEICVSLVLFTKSEYLQCFKTFNSLSDMPKAMEQEERCRIYAHSLRCVEENIADCEARRIHKLINSSSLEITRINGSVYDPECTVLEPSQSFCDDEETLLLYIYGKCYIDLLILSRTTCFMVGSLMDCVYNQTGELYFNCSKTSIRSALRNATSFYERKFPGYGQQITTCISLNAVLVPACTVESVVIDNADIYCKSTLAILQASCSSTSVNMYLGCIWNAMNMTSNYCTEDEVRSVMANATYYYEKLFPGEGLKMTKCIKTQERGNCTVDKEFFSTPDYIRCIASYDYGIRSGRGGNLTETKCRTYQRSLECTNKLNPACSVEDYNTMISLYYKSLESALLDPSECPTYKCEENKIMEMISNDQRVYDSVLPGSGLAITACISQFLSKTRVKRVAFTIKMTSGFFWDDSLLNPKSSYFQDLNKIIAGNFEKAFGAVPGLLNVTVSSFRKDTKYLDMAFRYDSSMLSIADATDAIQLVVQNRTIYRLQVENYFLYRGELKDGECPSTQSNRECLEECQMDSNCTGSEKCCYNGCGRTCQEPESGIHPCEDYEYIGQIGEQCSEIFAQNLTTASNREEFCLVTEKFLTCVSEGISTEKNVQCLQDQLTAAIKTFGPIMKSMMKLQSDPADCYEDLTTQISTTLEITTPQTFTDPYTTTQSVLLRYCRDSNTIISKGWRCVVPVVMNITTARNFAEYCSLVDVVYICIMDGMAADYNLTCRKSDKEFAIDLFSPMFKTAFNLKYNPGDCFAHETTLSTFPWISTEPTTLLPTISTTIATMTTASTPSPLLAKCSDRDVILSKTLPCVLPNFVHITAAENKEFCRIVDLIFVCIMTEIGSEYSVLCRENDKEVAIAFYGPTLQSELSLISNPVDCYSKTLSTGTMPSTSPFSTEPSTKTTETIQSTSTEFLSTTRTSQKFESTKMTTLSSKITPTTVTRPPFSGKCRDNLVVLSKGWQCTLPLFLNVTTAGNLYTFCSSVDMIFDCIMGGIELDYGVECTEEDRDNVTFFYTPSLQSAMALKYDLKECILLKQTTFSSESSMRPTTESSLLAICVDSDTILSVGWICALPLYMNISKATDMAVFCSVADSVYLCIMEKISSQINVQCTGRHKATVIRTYSASLQSISIQSFNPRQCYVMTTTTESITSLPLTSTTDNPLLAKCQDSASITSAAYICVLSLYSNMTTAENNSTFCSVIEVAFSCIMNMIETNHNIRCRKEDKEIMITSYGPDLKINLNLKFDPIECYTGMLQRSERVVRSTRFRRSSISLCQDDVTLFSKGIFCMVPVYNKVINENSSFQRFCSLLQNFTLCVMTEMAAEHNVSCGQSEYDTFITTHSPSMQTTMGLTFKPLDCLMMSSTTVEGPTTTPTIEATTTPFNPCQDPDHIFINLMPCIGPVFLSLKTESNFTVFCWMTSDIFECLINKIETSLNTTCSGTDSASAVQVYGSTIYSKLTLTYNPVLCYKNKSSSESSPTLLPSASITTSPLIKSSVGTVHPKISRTEAPFIISSPTFLPTATTAPLLINSTVFITVSPLVNSSLSLPQIESVTSLFIESSSAMIPSKSTTASPSTFSSAVFYLTTESSTVQTTAEPGPCQDLNKVTLHVLSCAGPIISSLPSAENSEVFCRLFLQVFDCIVNKTETTSNVSCSPDDKEILVESIGSQIISALLIPYDTNLCYDTTTITTTSSTPFARESTATTTTEPKHCRKPSQINSEILPCLGPLFPSITSAQNLQVFCRLMVNVFSCIINNIALNSNISCSEHDRLFVIRSFAAQLDQTISSPFKIMECTELIWGSFTTSSSYENVTQTTPTSSSASSVLTNTTPQLFSTSSSPTTSATGLQCRGKSEIFAQGIHCIGPLYRNFSTETEFAVFCRLLHSVFHCIMGRIEMKYNTTCSTSDLLAVKLMYGTEIHKSIPLNFDPDECPESTNCFEVMKDERYPKCFRTFLLYEKLKANIYNLQLSALETCSLYRGSLRCIGSYYSSCSIKDIHTVISHYLVSLNSTINPSICSVNDTYPSVCEDDEFSLLAIHADCGFYPILIPFDCHRHVLDFINCAAKSLSFLNCNTDSFWRALTILSSSNASFFDRVNMGRGKDVIACIDQIMVSMTTLSTPMPTEPPGEVSKLSFSIILSDVYWNTTLLDVMSDYYRTLTGYIDGNIAVVFGSDPAFLQIEVVSYRKNFDNLTKVDLEVTYNSSIHAAPDVYEQLKRQINSGLFYNLSVTSYLLFDGNTRNSSCPIVTSVSTICHDVCVQDTDCSTSEKCCSNGCGRICQNSTEIKSYYDLRYPEFPILQQNAEQMLVSVTLPDYQWTVELLDPNSSFYREIQKAVVTNFEEQMKTSTEFIRFDVSSLRNRPLVTADVIVTYNKNRISSSSVVNVLYMLSGHGFIHQLRIQGDLKFDKKVKPGVCPYFSMAVFRTCLDTCTGDTSCSGKWKCCFNGCARSCIDPDDVGVTPTVTSTKSGTTLTTGAITKVSRTYSTTETMPQQPTPLPSSGQQMSVTIELATYSWSDELLLNISTYYQELTRIVTESFREQFSGMQAFLGVEVKSFRSGGVFVDLNLSYDGTRTDAASLVNTIFLLLNHGYIHQLQVTDYLRYDYVVRDGTCPAVTRVASCSEQCAGDSRCPDVQKCCSNGCGQTCTDVWMPVSTSTTTEKPLVQISTTTLPANVGILSVTMELQDHVWDPSLLDTRSTYYQELETTIRTNVLQLFSQTKGIADVQITSFRSKQNRVDLVILYNANSAVLMDFITKMIEAREKQAVHDLKITSYMTFDTQLKEGTCPQASISGSCFEDCMGDGTCPGMEKCCSTGCGRLCTPAIQIR
ncbi:uncharacterized protein LOC133202542 [Saccostrea echinata]|uniref:uncharacterized protein LOC133202542 n=1 Tax=Saccostrea echinata TaxID=191078 RepID=UPI002A7EAEAD|nr:uncharacterized protein LOC133202542 [Saccostrea echinata]